MNMNFNRVTLVSLSVAAVFSISAGQVDRKHGQPNYPPGQRQGLCGIPVDTAQARRVLAAEDSMYKDYLSKQPKLSKVETIPNWRNMMSPVEYQWCSGEGDCWAHAATGVAEGQLHILIGSNIGINMDELDIVNNTVGCVVNYPTTAWAYIGYYKAISEVGSYPNLQGVRWGITGSSAGDNYGVSAIKGLLTRGPVSAAFYVYDDFYDYFESDTGAVYTHSGGGNYAGHAVVIVSYTDLPGGGGYWLCKNSWGDWWGAAGYFRIGYGQCGIDMWNNGTVTVDWSCVGKIVPNIFLTVNSALSYNFVNNEWIDVIGSTTLSGNATIPSGRTLALLSGANFNFGGYYVDASGTFNFGNGCALSTGTRYYSIYTSIASAVSAAVSGQTVSVNGSQTISSDLTVNSGVTLQLNSGSSILFGASNARWLISGTLNILGTSSSHVLLNGQGYSRISYAYPMVLTFSGGTANIQYADFTNAAYDLTTWYTSGSVSVQNSTFTNFGYNSNATAVTVNGSTGTISFANNVITGSNSQGTGIYIYNTSTNATVSSNTITLCGSGIHPYSSDGFLTGNIIWNNINYGIQADNVTMSAVYRGNDIRSNGCGLSLNSSSPWVVQNIIIENGLNVFCNSSDPSFAELPDGGSAGPGHNVIAHAPNPLVRVENSSEAYFGYDYNGGYNSFYDTDLPDFYVTNSSMVWADNNYWGEGPANIVDGSSTMLTDNPLSSDPNPDPLGKVAVRIKKGQNSLSVVDSSTGDDGSVLFQQAVQAEQKNDLKTASAILTSLINSSPRAKYASLGLQDYYRLIQYQNGAGRFGFTSTASYADLISLLRSLTSQPTIQPLRPMALRILAREAFLSRDFSQALALLNDAKDNYKGTYIELATLYDLVAYYVEVGQDLVQANTLVSEMVSKFPKETLTLMARVLVGEKVSITQSSPKGVDTTLEKSPGDAMIAAYPNPFNPSTKIAIGIPIAGNVSVIVYDVLGRQVGSLVGGHHEAGFYSAIWNASQQSSGVYFARLMVTNEIGMLQYSKTTKLLLMK